MAQITQMKKNVKWINDDLFPKEIYSVAILSVKSLQSVSKKTMQSIIDL